MKVMTGWLVYRFEDIKKNRWYIDSYIEEGKKLDIKIRLILVDKLDFGVKNNSLFLEYEGGEIEKPDFVVNRAIYPLLTKQLEGMGIRVFNNSMVAEICNDKAKTYQYISRLNIPVINTKFVKSEYLEYALGNITDPTIIKGVSGHGGNEVFLYNPGKDSQSVKEDILSELKQTDTVIQPFIEGKHQDLRVYVIGKTIIAAILRTGKDGFKSNFSLGGEVSNYTLSSDEIKLITTIINKFTFDKSEFGLVGIDFLIDNSGSLIFNEIEDVVGARMLYECTDINLVNLYLKFILSQI